VDGNSNNLFLLGAGFTKAVFPDAPLNKDLLNAIVKSGKKTLVKYQKRFKTEDIERLLTQLDLEAVKDEKIKQDRTIIEEEISLYFSKYRFSGFKKALPSWLDTFALNVLKKNDTIISLNYDCFLEGALDNYGVWSPNGGYARIINCLADSLPINPKKIEIFKIHGSENFRKGRVYGYNPNQTSINFIIEPTIFPVSAAHSHFGAGIESLPYIIAPSFIKIPHVDVGAMMLEALDKAEKARIFIIIGCSMRPEDSFLWLLLTRFLNKSLKERKQLIILDPSSEAIWERISNYWIGNIRDFADVSFISCGLETGVTALNNAINGVP